MTSPFGNAGRFGAVIAAKVPTLASLELSISGQLDRGELAAPKSDALLSRACELSVTGRHRGETAGGLGPIGRVSGLATVGSRGCAHSRWHTSA